MKKSSIPCMLTSIVILFTACGFSAEAKVKEGQAFPFVSSMKLKKLGSRDAFSTASLKGKVVLIDFWASWCEPCKAELPALNALYKKMHARGLEILGVNVDEAEADALEFLKGRPVDFPIVFDGEKKELLTAVEAQVMPTSLILDKQGNVHSIHRGFRTGDAAKFEDEISRLLN